MKVKEGFILRTVSDDNLVVPIGDASVDFKSIIKLNETGVFLWKFLEEGSTVDEMTAKMLEEYDADEELVRADFLAFCEKLEDAGIIE